MNPLEHPGEDDPDQHDVELLRLVSIAREWRNMDPDPDDRALTDAAIARGDRRELEDLFGSRLGFGTAGIRGPTGVGPARMNRLQVRQTAAGIARVLLAEIPAAPERGVVVSRDGRADSERFATDVIEVITSHGLRVHVIDGPAPTPLASFAVAHLRAAAGVVVTASHNPRDDNGIKVYWEDGAQIVEPVDARITAAIATLQDDGLLTADAEPAPVEHLGSAVTDGELMRAYLAAARRLLVSPDGSHPMSLAVTSLHGVGAELLGHVLEHFGFGPVNHVESQRAPDPDFPTVKVPNPEEPGVLDGLLTLATDCGASLAMANDPDADRLALAAPHPQHGWKVLTGDEIGTLLADHLLRTTDAFDDRLVGTTVVSSRMLSAMAAEAGIHFRETLTGFKWLCRPAISHPGWRQVLIYEEALGYAIGPEARDKDGITAALVAAEAAFLLAQDGRSVWDALDDLARRHGAHVTVNGSIRTEADEIGPQTTGFTRRMPASAPSTLGGLRVIRSDRPAHDILRFWLDDETRVALRPSGTEAKLKFYCEAIESVAPNEAPAAARARAATRLDPIIAELRSLLR